MSRCTGHCCERFNMRYSYEEFQRMKDALLNNKGSFTRDDGSIGYTPSDKDALKIADMLIPMKENTYLDHNGEAMIADHVPREGFEFCFVGTIGVLEAHWYTCKHFDKINRNCMNYENRPEMCKKHPYYNSCSEHCNYKKCTLAKREDAVNN